MDEKLVGRIRKLPDALLVSVYRAALLKTDAHPDASSVLCAVIEEEFADRSLNPDEIRGNTGFGTRPLRD